MPESTPKDGKPDFIAHARADFPWLIQQLREAHANVEAAVLAEREACAKVADDYRRDDPDRLCCIGRNNHIAAAIRAR